MAIAEEALGLIEILLLLFLEKYFRPPASTGAAGIHDLESHKQTLNYRQNI